MTISASGRARSKGRVRPLLVRGHDEGVAETFQELAQTKPTRYRAQKLAGPEIDLLWRRRRLAARVTRDLRNIVPGVGFGVTIDGIVVKHAQHCRHLLLRISAWVGSLAGAACTGAGDRASELPCLRTRECVTSEFRVGQRPDQTKVMDQVIDRLDQGRVGQVRPDRQSPAARCCDRSPCRCRAFGQGPEGHAPPGAKDHGRTRPGRSGAMPRARPAGSPSSRRSLRAGGSVWGTTLDQ